MYTTFQIYQKIVSICFNRRMSPRGTPSNHEWRTVQDVTCAQPDPRWTSYRQMSSRGRVGKRMQKNLISTKEKKKKLDVNLNRGRVKPTKLLLLKARDIWPGWSTVFACAGFKLWCNCGCFMQPFAIFVRFGEPSKYQRLLNVLAAGHSGSRKT